MVDFLCVLEDGINRYFEFKEIIIINKDFFYYGILL